MSETAGQPSADVLARPAPPPDGTRAYGADPAQVYDVRFPRGGVAHEVTYAAQPAERHTRSGSVVVVHGGFWRAEYDRAHTAAQGHALAQAGWHVAVGEYRRAGLADGGVPETLDDVAALVTRVRGDPDLPDPVVLLGHSAGGHLVAWAANQAWAAGLAGVVVLAGCVDLAATDRMGLGSGAARDFVGDDPEAWRAADPMTSLPPRVPVRLLHGMLDREVPVAVTDDYLAAARAAGGDVRLEVLPGVGHYELIDPDSSAWPRVLATLTALQPGPPQSR